MTATPLCTLDAYRRHFLLSRPISTIRARSRGITETTPANTGLSTTAATIPRWIPSASADDHRCHRDQRCGRGRRVLRRQYGHARLCLRRRPVYPIRRARRLRHLCVRFQRCRAGRPAITTTAPANTGLSTTRGSQTFTTLDDPSAFGATLPVAINNSGDVAGATQRTACMDFWRSGTDVAALRVPVVSRRRYRPRTRGMIRVGQGSGISPTGTSISDGPRRFRAAASSRRSCSGLCARTPAMP